MLGPLKKLKRLRKHGFRSKKRKTSAKTTKTVIGARRRKGRKSLAVTVHSKA